MPSHSPQADLAACRALLRTGSRTFFAASLLLPRHVRDPASALYAFCRLADDAIDDVPPEGRDAARLSALAQLRYRLDRAYAGHPQDIAADRALAHVVHTHAIPRTLPEALLEGFAWDSEVRQYETLEDVHAYAARVAGAVGAMMSLLMGGRAPDVVARACDLGVAMQLSNIARDVGEDAREGRLYLPKAWMRDAGINPDAWLANPVFTPALATVIARLLAEAERLYAQAATGVAALPLSCRPGISAARLLYAEIGRQVARNGYNSVATRAVVAPARKLRLLAASVGGSVLPAPACAAPSLAATRYLVEAASAAPPPRRTIRPRTDTVLEIFERMAERDRMESDWA